MTRTHADPEAERAAREQVAPPERVAGPTLLQAGNQAATAVFQTFEVGRADDAAEHEADALAARALGGVIRRDSHGVDRLGGTSLDAATSDELHRAQGGGTTLPGGVRRDLERGFGTGLGGVRVHDDGQADRLARRVDATAFTTGQDVFFRRGAYAPETDTGRHVLAHEVAHTLQSTGTVRRLMSAKQFKASTYTGGHQRGDAVKAIDKHLADFERMKAAYDVVVASAPGGAAVQPKGKKVAAPLGQAAKIANLEQRIQLILEMEGMAERWIEDHTITVPDTAAPTGTPGAPARPTPPGAPAPTRQIEDPKRKQRMEGMKVFLKGGSYAHKGNVGNKEITQPTPTSLRTERTNLEMTLLSLRAAAGGAAGATTPAVESARFKKIKRKYEGNAKSMFTSLAPLVNLAVPNEGDSVEVDLEAKIPVDQNAVGFVLFHLLLSATHDSITGDVVGAEGHDNIVLRGELTVGAGVNIADLVELKGELGLYAESSANSAEAALTLFSYGVYRRWRESRVMNTGMVSYMWSSRTGEFGYEKSEAWANQVEKEQFSDQTLPGGTVEENDAYVETGGLGKVSGKAGKSFDGIGAEIEGSLTFGGGRRYNKASIERAKGAGNLGARNTVDKTTTGPGGVKTTTRQDATAGAGPQTLLSDDTFFFEIASAFNVTPISGGIKIMGKFARPASRSMVNPNPWVAEAVELQGTAGFTIPDAGSDIASKVVRPIATAVMALPGIVRTSLAAKKGELQKEGRSRGTGAALDLATAAVPTISEYAKSLSEPTNWSSIGTDLEDATSPTVGTTATLGLAVGFDFVEKKLSIEISTTSKLEWAIPLFFEGSISKKKRVFALIRSQSGWTVK